MRMRSCVQTSPPLRPLVDLRRVFLRDKRRTEKPKNAAASSFATNEERRNRKTPPRLPSRQTKNGETEKRRRVFLRDKRRTEKPKNAAASSFATNEERRNRKTPP